MRATPNTSAYVFEYHQRIAYTMPFSPTSGRCQAIRASAALNMFDCFLGKQRIY
jgi:hypothetical protein